MEEEPHFRQAFDLAQVRNYHQKDNVQLGYVGYDVGAGVGSWHDVHAVLVEVRDVAPKVDQPHPLHLYHHLHHHHSHHRGCREEVQGRDVEVDVVFLRRDGVRSGAEEEEQLLVMAV